MNKQLQLLDNEIIAPKKTSKRILGKREIADAEKPWKLSETDRNQGLAGIAMIKQILASAPNTLLPATEIEFAKAS